MNRRIIEQFEKLIKQIEAEYLNSQAEGDNKEITINKHRLYSIRNSLAIIKDLKKEIKSVDDLKGIPGIGKGTLARVKEILETGTLSEIGNTYDTEKQNIINSIQELQNVIGIGKVTARNLVVKNKIRSVEELRDAVATRKIKVNHVIKLGLKYHGLIQNQIPRTEITKTRNYLIKQVSQIDSRLEIMLCGSYRRGKKTSGDIDLLLFHPDIKNLDQITNPQAYGLPQYLHLFINKLSTNGFLLDHLTDHYPSILYMGFCQTKKDQPIRRIDIRYIPFTSLPTAMIHFTGPFELNAFMRHEAKKRGMILNEYGLFMRDSDREIRLDIQSEADVFEILGMPYLTPQQRNSFDSNKIKYQTIK